MADRDLLSIGKSAVAAQQLLLRTTSNNIANVATENYVRQRSVTTTCITGLGVGQTITQRLNDTFKQQEVWKDNASSSYYSTVYEELYPIDQYLSDASIGLSGPMTRVFTSLESAVNNPTSEAERNEFMADLQDYLNRYDSLYDDIEKISLDNQMRIDETITQANDLIETISTINLSIMAAGDRRDSTLYNLIDQRDAAVSELSKLMDIRTYKDELNSNVLAVYMSTGQSLVLEDGTHVAFDQVNKELDPESCNVSVRFVNSSDRSAKVMPNTLFGGKIGALLESRAEIIEAKKGVSQATIALADAFNRQNAMGLDLNGQAGGDLFSIPAAKVSDGAGNSLSVSVADGSRITTADFLVETDASGIVGITVLDSAGNELEKAPGDYASAGALLAAYGLSIDVTSATHDSSFIIKPTELIGRQIAMATSDASRLAFASRYSAETSSANMGTAVAALSLTSGANAAALANLTVGVENGCYQVSLDGGATHYDVPLSQGGENLLASLNRLSPAGWTVTDYGFDISVTGTVYAGDSFRVADNSGSDRSSDNSNGLFMTRLQNEELSRKGTTAGSGSQSLTARYAGITSEFGSKVHSADVNQLAAEAKLTQSTESYQSATGVSLDEEAAHLVQYQQYYSAAAKVISAAQNVFQSLLNAV